MFNMIWILRRLFFPKPLLALLLILLAIVAITPACADPFLLQVTADPERVPYVADAVNRSTIRVQVRDADGSPAPNQTIVYFKTTLGQIPDQARTQNGMVAVALENYMLGPGRAVVYVEVGGSQTSIQVEFFGEMERVDSEPTEGRPSYRLRARQVYFSVSQRVFDISYCEYFRAPNGLTIQADSLQFSLKTYLLTAQRSIVMTLNERTITADGLRYNLQSGEGVLVQQDENFQTHYFTIAGEDMELSEVAQEDWSRYQGSFTPLETRPTKTWIISREATVYPGDQIHFKRPGFYLDGSRALLMKVPFHVIDYQDTSDYSFLNMKVGLTSDGGIDADFPLYYAADKSHTGSLHFRHVTKRSTFYRGNTGLQISLEEEYYAGPDGDGTLYIDDLARNTRSLDWDHVHMFGPLRTAIGASYQRNDANNPYTTRGYLTLSRPLGQVNANLSTNWSNYNKNISGFADMSFYLPSLPLGKSAYSLGFSPNFGWRGLKVASTADSTLRSSEVFYQGLRVSLHAPSYRVLGGMLSPSLSDQVSHDSTGRFSNTVDAGLRYQRALFDTFSTSLSYSYSLSQSNRDTAPQTAAQRLSLDLFGSGKDWTLFGYTSYNLTDESLFSSVNFEYRLPWLRSADGQRGPFLRASTSVNISPFGGTNADSFFSLGRQLGDYALFVHYSPSGNNAVTGIGTGTGQEWAVELVRM